jgi:hypothetical protein
MAGPDTREALRRFLRATVDELSTNPLWRRLMTHPEESSPQVSRLRGNDRNEDWASRHLTAVTTLAMWPPRDR